jgi:hypothetical protein
MNYALYPFLRFIATIVAILALFNVIFVDVKWYDIILYWFTFNFLTSIVQSYLFHKMIMNDVAKVREEVIRDGGIAIHLKNNAEIRYKPIGEPIAKLGETDIFENISIVSGEATHDIYEYVGVVLNHDNVQDQISQILNTKVHKEVISFSNGLIYGIRNVSKENQNNVTAS